MQGRLGGAWLVKAKNCWPGTSALSDEFTGTDSTGSANPLLSCSFGQAADLLRRFCQDAHQRHPPSVLPTAHRAIRFLDEVKEQPGATGTRLNDDARENGRENARDDVLDDAARADAARDDAARGDGGGGAYGDAFSSSNRASCRAK